MKRRDRYFAMFKDLGPAVRGAGKRIRIEDVIPWSLQFLKKDDRIIWYLSILQRYALYLLREKSITKTRKQKKKISRKLKGFTDKRVIDDFECFSQEKWEHCADMQAVFMDPQMLAFSFYEKKENKSIPKTAHEVFRHFNEVEKKVIAQPGGERFCNDGVPFLECDDGACWFMIEDGFSSQEAKAMRHCGNGLGRKGDVLLSLREPHKKSSMVLWKPKLTFIVNGGFLGEMKGFANQKPEARYHSHIEKLLMQENILGIKGGGFLPKSNFSFLDLVESAQIRILKAKPNFTFDVIPTTGKELIKVDGYGEWQTVDHASMPDSATALISGFYNEISQWYVFRKFIQGHEFRHHISVAWCFLEGGKISYLHQEGEGVNATALLPLLLRPEIKLLGENILDENSSWGQSLAPDGIQSLMEKKPSLFLDASLQSVLEKVGVSEAFVGVFNAKYGMNISLSGDLLYLQNYRSASHFAECTGIGSMPRKISFLENHMKPGLQVNLFGLDWLKLRIEDDFEKPISLVLKKSATNHFFDTLNVDEEEDLYSFLQEIIFRYGPPEPKIDFLSEAA